MTYRLGSWDTHTHIAELNRFPLPPKTGANYSPHAASLTELKDHLKDHDIANVVLVQPSTYGFDNSCLIWGLNQINQKDDTTQNRRKARGIVVIDPDNLPARTTLNEWHDAGIRGVRLNLKSVGKNLSDPVQLHDFRLSIENHIEAIKHFGKSWCLQVYADLEDIQHLAFFVKGNDGLMGNGTRLVIDHLGQPSKIEDDMKNVKGWDGLLKLLDHEGCFVKLSAPYRLLSQAQGSNYSILEGAVQDLISIRDGKAVLWASDWPHTRFDQKVNAKDVDIWAESCREWCGKNEERVERLFCSNAESLYDS